VVLVQTETETLHDQLPEFHHVFRDGVSVQRSKRSSFEGSEDWPDCVAFDHPDMWRIVDWGAFDCDINLKLREVFFSGIRLQRGIAAAKWVAPVVRRLGV
jgi:hypothetical protein